MGLEHILTLVPALTDDAIVIAEVLPHHQVERLVWLNEAFTLQTGYGLGDLAGADPMQVLHGDLLSAVQQGGIGERLQDGLPFRGDLRCRRRHGSVFTADVSIVPWQDPETGATYTVRVFRDVTEARQRELGVMDALAERDRPRDENGRDSARITQALDMLPCAFALFDPDRRLVTFNRPFWRSYSDREGEIRPGMHIVDLARIGYRNGRFVNAAQSEKDFLAEVDRVWLTHTRPVEREYEPGHFERIMRSRTPMGDIVNLRIDVTEAKQQEQRLQAYSAALERANAEIREQAIRDALTGVLNRRGHQARLDRLLQERAAGGDEFALLHVDLDRFKQINDAFGHATGDEALCHVAGILTDLTGDSDCVARLGGDEFLITLPMRGGIQPMLLARRILGRLAVPYTHMGNSCRIGASIGIAVTPVGGTTGAELAARSDYALYKAKRGGRNRVRDFDHDMRLEVSERQSLSEDLMAGLERGEIEPAYQLQVDAGSHDLHGVEALARWRHPDRGLLEPELFMPIAEELGVVAEIDRQVFVRAIDEMTAMCGRGVALPRLSFNVSTGRVCDRQILAEADRMRNFPGQVVFELLESIFVEQADIGFLTTVDRLRDMGVVFEVDDFGSGHSSIIALIRIAPERLKIDSRLVAPIIGSDSALQLVRAVHDIGQALDIAITAEGVESAAHAEMLREIGCSVLQGHHFSRPVAAAEFERLLRAETWRQTCPGPPRAVGGGPA